MFGRLVVWVLPHARLPEGMVTAYETCPRACAHRCHNRKYCFARNLLCNLLRNLLRLRFGWAEGLRPKNLLQKICYTMPCSLPAAPMSCVFCFAPLTHGVTICLGKRLALPFDMFDNQRSTLGGRAHMLRGSAQLGSRSSTWRIY